MFNIIFMGIEMMMMVWYILESLLTLLKLNKWNSIKTKIYDNQLSNKFV